MARPAPRRAPATSRSSPGASTRERVRSKAFLVSTLLMAGLAVVIALIPLAVRVVDRATVTQVAIASDDPALSARAVAAMDAFLNANLDGSATRGAAVRVRGRGLARGRGRRRQRRPGLGRRADRAQARWRPRLPGRDGRRPRPGQGPDPPDRRVRGRRPRLDRVRATERRAVRSAHVRRGRCRRGDGRRGRRDDRHRGVREPADRRHRVRGALVPDPRVLRPVGGLRRRGREGEPGHGAADQRGHGAAARGRQDHRHRAGRADPGRRWC